MMVDIMGRPWDFGTLNSACFVFCFNHGKKEKWARVYLFPHNLWYDGVMVQSLDMFRIILYCKHRVTHQYRSPSPKLPGLQSIYLYSFPYIKK